MTMQHLRHNRAPWHWGSASFLVVTGTITLIAITWILALSGVFPSILATIISVLFTALGLLLSLLQFIRSRFSSEHQIHTFRVENVDLGLSPYQGALVILSNTGFRGTSINLCKGFYEHPPEPEMAGCVNTYRINGRSSFAAIFPSLRPDNYTVFDHLRQQIGMVTIHPNQVTRIDWSKATSRESELENVPIGKKKGDHQANQKG